MSIRSIAVLLSMAVLLSTVVLETYAHLIKATGLYTPSDPEEWAQCIKFHRHQDSQDICARRQEAERQAALAKPGVQDLLDDYVSVYALPGPSGGLCTNWHKNYDRVELDLMKLGVPKSDDLATGWYSHAFRTKLDARLDQVEAIWGSELSDHLPHEEHILCQNLKRDFGPNGLRRPDWVRYGPAQTAKYEKGRVEGEENVLTLRLRV